jgi:hypothetical protein
MTLRNKALLAAIFYFIVITVLSIRIPFFWDGTFFSASAVTFYENGWNGLLPATELDTGGFPLYSSCLCLCWKVFGKSLTVSHLAMLPFIISIVILYYRLASKFLEKKFLAFAMLLLVLEPALNTQSILMGYDILMVCFFLLAANMLLEQKRNYYAVALVLLSCSSMRGLALCAALFVIDLLLNKSGALKKLIAYLPLIFSLTLWNAYHYNQCGWILFSPEREGSHESVVSLPQMGRQFLYFFWKLADNGKIFFWIFCLIAFLKIRGRLSKSALSLFLFIPAIALLLLMVPLGNPIGHKYFIVVFLMLNIFCCVLLERLNYSKTNLVFGFLALMLFCGNFWIYPSRYGNSWDSSLKVLPVFSLQERMDNYISEAGIDPKKVGTQFPFISDPKYSCLKNGTAYTNVWQGPLENFEYFLNSNVINTDIPDQIETMEKSWILLKRFSSGQVWISLYKNKNEKIQ